jgi:hypothetical protein
MFVGYKHIFVRFLLRNISLFHVAMSRRCDKTGQYGIYCTFLHVPIQHVQSIGVNRTNVQCVPAAEATNCCAAFTRGARWCCLIWLLISL